MLVQAIPPSYFRAVGIRRVVQIISSTRPSWTKLASAAAGTGSRRTTQFAQGSRVFRGKEAEEGGGQEPRRKSMQSTIRRRAPLLSHNDGMTGRVGVGMRPFSYGS